MFLFRIKAHFLEGGHAEVTVAATEVFEAIAAVRAEFGALTHVTVHHGEVAV